MPKYYHISDTWNNGIVQAIPRTGRVDDSNNPLDMTPFIAVCPSVEQCIVAIGEWRDCSRLTVYRATTEHAPVFASWVFDSAITDEHRFYVPTAFERVFDIDVVKLASSVPIRKMSGVGNDTLLQNIRLSLDEITLDFAYR